MNPEGEEKCTRRRGETRIGAEMLVFLRWRIPEALNDPLMN